VVKNDKGKIVAFTKGASTGVEPLLLNLTRRTRLASLELVRLLMTPHSCLRNEGVAGTPDLITNQRNATIRA